MNRGLRNRRRRGAAIAAPLLLCVLMMAPLRGAIIFTDVPDVNLMAGGFGGEVFYNVDFTGDGVAEVRMQGSGGDFGVIALTTTTVAGIRSGPLDLNGFAHPFGFGDLIAPEPPQNRSWNQGMSALLGCREIGCIGLWTSGGTNYIGVEFLLGTDTHYGWVAIDMPAIFGGGILLSYAYESEPNTPIIAGAIPEPSSTVLVATGTVLLWKRNAKTRKENKALLPTPRGWLVSTLNLIRKCLCFGGAHTRP